MKTAVFLSLILLASCATPPPPATGGGDVAFDAMVARATEQAANDAIAATATAQDSQRATAAALVHVEATRAAIIATQTASPIETQQAVAIIVTQQAQATAASHAQSLEAIAIASFATREAGDTIATRAVQNLEIGAKAKNARRWEWVKDIGAGIFLFILFGGAIIMGKIQLFKHRSVFTTNGEPIVINGDWLTEDDPPMLPAPRVLPFTPHRGQTQTIEMEEPAFPLTRPNGRAVIYNFTDADIHALKLNLLTGDHGFRRVKSDKGRGMDELIGLSNGDKYRSILAAMKANGWLCSVGNASQWTNDGAIDVLGLEALPPQNHAGE